MKERPILFSAPMIRAILDGRKTHLLKLCDEAIRDDERATPGPWRVGPGSSDMTVNVLDGNGWSVVIDAVKNDAAAIAAARTREPVLARALREVLVRDDDIESDAHAYTIKGSVFVDPVDPGGGGGTMFGGMSPREARSLAASLLRAADEAEGGES